MLINIKRIGFGIIFDNDLIIYTCILCKVLISVHYKSAVISTYDTHLPDLESFEIIHGKDFVQALKLAWINDAEFITIFQIHSYSFKIFIQINVREDLLSLIRGNYIKVLILILSFGDLHIGIVINIHYQIGKIPSDIIRCLLIVPHGLKQTAAHGLHRIKRSVRFLQILKVHTQHSRIQPKGYYIFSGLKIIGSYCNIENPPAPEILLDLSIYRDQFLH